MAARRNRDGAALSLFADVLQEARHAAGLNSDDLGAKLGYSGSDDPVGGKRSPAAQA